MTTLCKSHRKLLAVTLSITLASLIQCGGSSVNFSPPATSSCSESGSTVTSANLSIAITGTACDAPSASSSTDSVGILDCTDRDTDDGDVDYATATCGSGDGAASVGYYCDTGIVIKKGDDADETLFAQTQITCTVDGSDVGSIDEEELVVSSLTDL